MRTLTIKKTTGVTFDEGWHEVVMTKAVPGKYSGGEGTKYLDVFFDGFPESLKLRVHEKFNKETNEEFAVLNLYRFSNSGIKEVLEGTDGNMTIGIEDEPENLIGNKVNVFFYKNKEGYTNVSEIIAPAVFKNDLEEFDEAGVERMKSSCESRIKKYLANNPAENSTPDPWD